ncbi:MAG TPA: ATP synthase F1 subunit epsilon [Candidatus Saccharimonadales bacterium]|nr:ATP synthase F1 subunit epsilon [Candidatus Saccharimonadales bacterium]
MLHLQLVTLTGTKFDDDVYEVVLPTLDGQIGVLPGHMPLISAATNGVISIRRTAKDPDYAMEHFATHGGVIEVADNRLRVIVDEADTPDEINEHEAKAALERAEKLKLEAKDQVSLEHAQALVDRSAVRLQVAGLKRRHQSR